MKVLIDKLTDQNRSARSMARKGVYTGLAAVAGLAFAGPAVAARVDLSSFNSENGANANDGNVSVTTEDAGDAVDLTFQNNTSGTLTDVYFEYGNRAGKTNLQWQKNHRSAHSDSEGVEFVPRATPENFDLAGAEQVGWTANGFSFGARFTQNEDGTVGSKKPFGVDQGDSITVSIDKGDSFTNVSDLVDRLNTRGTRVGAYVRYNNNGRVAMISGSDGNDDGDIVPSPTPAPSPAAIWPGLALLGGMGLKRRRQKQNA